jgi:hypothetical protein
MGKNEDKEKKRGYVQRLIDSYRNGNRKTFILLRILYVMVILTGIRCVFTKNYESLATCVLVLALFLVPALIEDKMDLTIPPLFKGIIFVFIFAAEILGEVDHYYVKIPGWDTMLHTINGFLFAAVGFSMIYLLNRSNEEFNLSPLYLALVAFCFSMTIGVIWEFFECAMDQFFNMDMQKDFVVSAINSVSLDPENSGEVIHVKDIVETAVTTSSGETTIIKDGYLDVGILDTMKDLLVNLIGAVVFSTIGYISLRASGSSSRAGRVAESLMAKPNIHEE